MFINNIDIKKYLAKTYNGNITANIHVDFCYFTILKDYVPGLEVLAGYLPLLYYLFQGRVVDCSHSSFIITVQTTASPR